MPDPVVFAEQLDGLVRDMAAMRQRHEQLVEAHHAGHEGFHGRLDEQRRRMDTLSAAQQQLHTHLLELQAQLRELKRAQRGRLAELPALTGAD